MLVSFVHLLSVSYFSERIRPFRVYAYDIQFIQIVVHTLFQSCSVPCTISGSPILILYLSWRFYYANITLHLMTHTIYIEICKVEMCTS